MSATFAAAKAELVPIAYSGQLSEGEITETALSVLRLLVDASEVREIASHDAEESLNYLAVLDPRTKSSCEMFRAGMLEMLRANRYLAMSEALTIIERILLYSKPVAV